VSLKRDKAWETSDDGILLTDGIWISSGSAAPTHAANNGDRFFQTSTGTGYIRKAGVWVTEADAFTGASPGFVFGSPGVVSAGSYLDNGRNPSNISGVLIDVGATPKLTKIAVVNKLSQIFSITIQEHDQSTFTDITTVVVTPAAKTKSFTIDLSLTDQKQLAVKVADASANNPQNVKVTCTLKGSS